MPLTRFKLSAIGDDGITGAKLEHNIHLDGTEAARLPVGTTAQRANAQVGDLRHNTDTGILEQYTADGWQGIASPPVVSSVSPDNVDEIDDPQTIVITGSNFDSGASAVLVNSSSQTVSPTTSTRNSSSQITIVFSGGDTLTTDAGPYDVRVTNGNGLSGTLPIAVTLDNQPTWTTSAGSLGTVYEDVAMSTITVAATDPEGSSITYSVTSGALPTGLSLGSANGQITGTPNVNDTYNASGVTHNFDITADDGTGNTTPRSFSILRKWLDGSTSALAANNPDDLADLGITTSGFYWLKIGDSKDQDTTARQYAVCFDYGAPFVMTNHIPKATTVEDADFFNGTQSLASGNYGSGSYPASGGSGNVGDSYYWRYPAYWGTNNTGTDFDFMVTPWGTTSTALGGSATTFTLSGGYSSEYYAPIGAIFRGARLDAALNEDISTGSGQTYPSYTLSQSADGVNFSSVSLSPGTSSGWSLTLCSASSGNLPYNGSTFGSGSGYILHSSVSDTSNNIGELYGAIDGRGSVGSYTGHAGVAHWVRPTSGW